MRRNRILHVLVNPFFVILFLFVLFSITAFRLELGYDESLWTYIGSLWNDREIPPYIGAVENKTPGIFILFAISDFLTSGNIFFVRGIGVIATIITAVFLFKICTKIHNKISGVICLYVFGLITCWNSMDGFAFAHTEVFMILFTTVAFYFFICSQSGHKKLKWFFLAGLSVGIAIAFKQIAIVSGIALVLIFIILSREKKLVYIIKGTAITVFGICISTVLSYLVLYFYGVSFFDYIEGAWLILFDSASKIQSIAAHFNNFIGAFVFSRFMFFYPLIFWFFWKKNILKQPYKILIVLWFVFDFIGVNASGYYFGHQIKQLLPVFSIIVGISIYNILTQKIDATNEYFKNKVALIILIICVVCFPYRQIYSNMKLVLNYDAELVEPHLEIANWIKQNSNTKDYIYIVGGEPNLIRTQAYAERMSSSKYFHSIFITSNIEREILMKDLQLNPPKFILKDEFIDKELFNKYGERFKFFLEEKYELVEIMHDVKIFKRFLVQ